VSLLKMNAGIGVSVQRSTDLQHSNAMLEEQVAELSSGERIQDTAQRMGLIVPDAGAVGYLSVRPGIDAQQAARNMTAPSQAARDDLLAGGRTASTPVAPATTTTTTTTPVAPVATATPAPVVTATPAPVVTATPVPTAVAPVTATPTPQPVAGAVAAPSGQ